MGPINKKKMGEQSMLTIAAQFKIIEKKDSF